MDAKGHIEKGGYVEAVGRRKTAVARVRIMKAGKKGIEVNGVKIEEYFPTSELITIAKIPLKDNEEFNATIKVKGGGVSSQAEAIRLGITRALVDYAPEERKKFKALGFLRRDARVKERKKFGLRKARRAPQWSKR